MNDNTHSNNTDRFLSFSLGEEEYAMPLLSVREVIDVPEITHVPFTPPHFLGIMNLRGQVISVIDLRHRLGIKPQNAAETAIIICDMAPLCIGVMVDSINSVLSPDPSQVSDKPQIQSTRNTDYITGVYRKDKQLVIFLDIAKCLGAEDLKAAQGAGAKQAA
ncbi:MAG: chemotaxis protein CheW [Bdellovibrionaceae bacterium]|nr:chemotaxis protein CheW [Pseudobdellovibrionaceae bacterium]